ncbi:MAG: hypothetical protein ACHRHE_04960 [Tepidisphaerales bacterium]
MAATMEFACSACGRKFPWKPEWAGKSAKCKCGAVVRVPAHIASEAADGQPSIDDLAGLADGPEVVSVAAPPPAAKATRRAPSVKKAAEPGKKEYGMWQYFGLAALMVALSIWQYYDLTAFEEQGGTRYLNRVSWLLYSVVGKWGVVGFGLLLACIMVAGAIYTMRQKQARND